MCLGNIASSPRIVVVAAVYKFYVSIVLFPVFLCLFLHLLRLRGNRKLVHITFPPDPVSGHLCRSSEPAVLVIRFSSSVKYEIFLFIEIRVILPFFSSVRMLRVARFFSSS